MNCGHPKYTSPFTDVPPDETPHGCYEGFVYICYMVENPEIGRKLEVIEPVPCRRCSEAGEDH
jgi:hypothetical protein